MLHYSSPLYFSRLVIVLGFVLVGLVMSRPAQAQTTISLAAVTIELNLRTDGQVEVHQVLKFASPNSLAWKLYSNARDLHVQANGQLLNRQQFSEEGFGSRTIVESALDATEWTIDYTTTSTLIRHNNRDQIYFKVFQELGRTTSDIKITLNLPGTSEEPGLNGNIYAIGGALGAQTSVVSARQITFTARYAGPKAILTVSANWPKGVLQLGTIQEWRLALLNLEIIPWLGLGLFLPLVGLIVLLRLKLGLRSSERSVKEVVSQPPSALSPTLVGVLVRKKIYPEEITALLINLCQRGYIVIVKKHDRYYLSLRRAADDQLENWERQILLQLFPDRSIAVSQTNFENTNQQLLFSPQVRDAFAQIYQVITAKNFFAENPHLTRVRYKLFALSLYFASIIGALWTAVAGVSPLLLIPLVGTIGVAFLIIRLSPQLIHYSIEGAQARLGWLSFANFLSQKKPLPIEATQNQTFEKYLPYAVALGVMTQWAKRFDLSSTIIVRPDWFISYEDGSTVQFTEEITKFTNAIAKEIASLRGPLVS